MPTPTVTTGMGDTYNNGNIAIRNLEPHLQTLEATDYPLLKAVGLDSYKTPIENVKVEWQFDYFVPLEDAIDEVANIDGVVTAIGVDHEEYFAKHDVILVESELMLVTGIDTINHEIDVIRGFAGSANVAHNDNTVITRIGPAREEGSSPGWSQHVDSALVYNYTQIFDVYAEVSGTEQNSAYYGVTNPLDARMDKALKGLYQMMERSLMHGKTYAGTAALPRTTGGLLEYIQDVTDLNGAALGYDDIEDVLEAAFLRVGMSNVPDMVWGNSLAKKAWNGFAGTGMQFERTETTWGTVIDNLLTSFGRVGYNLDHLIPQDILFILNMETVQGGSFKGRALSEYDATQPGDDKVTRRMLGEYAWVIKGEDGVNDGLNAVIIDFI